MTKPLSDSPKARQMRELRAKRKALHQIIAPAMADGGRLPLWDENNEMAIERALLKLGVDWAEFVTENEFDPLAQVTLSSESESDQ